MSKRCAKAFTVIIKTNGIWLLVFHLFTIFLPATTFSLLFFLLLLFFSFLPSLLLISKYFDKQNAIAKRNMVNMNYPPSVILWYLLMNTKYLKRTFYIVSHFFFFLFVDSKKQQWKFKIKPLKYDKNCKLPVYIYI